MLDVAEKMYMHQILQLREICSFIIVVGLFEFMFISCGVRSTLHVPNFKENIVLEEVKV